MSGEVTRARPLCSGVRSSEELSWSIRSVEALDDVTARGNDPVSMLGCPTDECLEELLGDALAAVRWRDECVVCDPGLRAFCEEVEFANFLVSLGSQETDG